MSRIPELQEVLLNPQRRCQPPPAATEAEAEGEAERPPTPVPRDVLESAAGELEQLTKTAAGLIAKLPLVLPQSDARHVAALAEMVAQLTDLLQPNISVWEFLPSSSRCGLHADACV